MKLTLKTALMGSVRGARPIKRWRRYAAIDVNTLPDFLVFAPALAKWMGAKLILDLHEIAPEFFMSKYHSAENSRTVASRDIRAL